ncbi:MAG TPA: hypothetical protein EYP79_00085 [Campylobacterales bacterium]|nr:hypothetical protein [Campylobacterales bacterium]
MESIFREYDIRGIFDKELNEDIVKKIGFFLTLRNQRLNVSIFARGNRNIRERYTANLDAFTELRLKRLN